MILWESKYEMGIDAIDQQHRQLVEMTSELSELLTHAQVGDDIYDEMMEIIARLKAYTIQHFEDEEALMAQSGYHALDIHAIEHKRLIDDLDALDLTLADQDQVAFGKGVLKFLITWVFKHISGSDFLYKETVVSHLMSC